MSISDYSARRLGGPVPPWLRDAETARPIPVEVWVTGALMVIAAVIRIIVINDQSFWQDEALTAYEAQLPLGAMINTVVNVETTPPLYFVVIWAWRAPTCCWRRCAAPRSCGSSGRAATPARATSAGGRRGRRWR